MKRDEKRKSHTTSCGGGGGEKKRGSGAEGLNTNSHFQLEGSEEKKKLQDEEKQASVWWRRRGRGKERQAVSREAAAGRSPGEKKVRAGPSGNSSGSGRRRRTLHSLRELRAAAAGRHTLARRPGSALAPRAAQVSAAQGPHTAPRFAPSYFGSRWETAGGLRVDRGLRACGLSCAVTGQRLEISEES